MSVCVCVWCAYLCVCTYLCLCICVSLLVSIYGWISVCLCVSICVVHICAHVHMCLCKIRISVYAYVCILAILVSPYLFIARYICNCFVPACKSVCTAAPSLDTSTNTGPVIHHCLAQDPVLGRRKMRKPQTLATSNLHSKQCQEMSHGAYKGHHYSSSACFDPTPTLLYPQATYLVVDVLEMSFPFTKIKRSTLLMVEKVKKSLTFCLLLASESAFSWPSSETLNVFRNT